MEKQEFFSYGFYERKLEVASHRAKLTDPEMREFLQLRAGEESTINELYHKSGKQTRYTGTTKVKNASVATAIGINVGRVARYLQEGAAGEPSVA